MLAANGSQEQILDNNTDGQTVISTLTNLEVK
jgi:hypothetical protein